MSGGPKIGGYTLVEVMMFLAISGALFVLAALTISGKQNQAQFAQGTRDFQSKIEDLSNDIATGYFPDQASSYQCGYSGTVGTVISFSSGSTETQGRHEQCVFLGKVLFFTRDTGDVATISVAGGRENTRGMSISNYSEAKPVPVAGISSGPNLTETFSLGSGMIITDIISKEGATIRHPSAFGIFTSLPQYNSGVTSGALTTDFVSIPNSDNGIISGTADTITVAPVGTLYPKIEAMATTAPYINPEIIICMRHGQGGKPAGLVLGTKNRQAYSEIHIDDIATVVADIVGPGGPTCP